MKTNMRSGFTMIELVFVIVIIGILSAVALPKFLGTSQEAHNSVIKSFAGTLNRTVGPALWSKSLSEGNAGVITSYCGELEAALPTPDELTNSGDCNYAVVTAVGGTLSITMDSAGDGTAAPVWSAAE